MGIVNIIIIRVLNELFLYYFESKLQNSKDINVPYLNSFFLKISKS